MATILQYLVYGLQLGSVYALLALGYTMVYGIVGMINTAHGDFLMIGALGTYFIAKLFDNMSIDGTYPMLAVGCIILIAMVMTGGIASGVEAIAYRLTGWSPGPRSAARCVLSAWTRTLRP